MAQREKVQAKLRGDVAQRLAQFKQDQEIDAESHAVERLVDDGLRSNGYHASDRANRALTEFAKAGLYIAGAAWIVTAFSVVDAAFLGTALMLLSAVAFGVAAYRGEKVSINIGRSAA